MPDDERFLRGVVRGAPQRGQNAKSPEIALPHAAHAAPCSAPQCGQKRASGGTSRVQVLQRASATVPW